MAGNSTVAAMTAASALDGTELLYSVQGGNDRKMTPTQVGSYLAISTLAGGTLTASAPMTLTQTWNNAGVTFTGLKLNVTATASAAASLLMDLQVGGTSAFQVIKSGVTVLGNSTTAGYVAFGLATSARSGVGALAATPTIVASILGDGSAFANHIANNFVLAGGGSFVATSTGTIGFSNGTGVPITSTTQDVFLTRSAAATLQLGAADAASPVAQTLQVQSVVAGTSNTAGTDWSLQSSLSTGTGTAGNVIRKASFSGVTYNATSVTVTSASPGVVTLTAHGFVPGQVFQFASGTPPTGTSLATNYFVSATGLAVNTFQFSATNGGASINTSSTGTSVTISTGSNISSPQNPASTIATWGPYGLTGSQTTALLNLAQVWNMSGVASGLKFNVTNIASSSTSTLLDLQVNAATVFKVTRTGAATVGALIGPVTAIDNNTTLNGVSVGTGGQIFFVSTTNPTSGTPDVILNRDAANTLALRNSTTAQKFSVYNTFTDASNYERGVLDWATTGNTFTVGTEAAGTGTQRQMLLKGSSQQFQIGGTNIMLLNSSGNLTWNTDNTYDIGASAGTRPRDLFLARNLGLGSVAPSATFLAMGVGTTAKSQMNWGTTSVAPTSPNNGDMWFDGTDLKIRIGGSTKTVTVA